MEEMQDVAGSLFFMESFLWGFSASASWDRIFTWGSPVVPDAFSFAFYRRASVFIQFFSVVCPGIVFG